MDSSLIVVLLSFVIAVGVACGTGWYLPYAERKSCFYTGTYKFGYLIGGLYIFFGLFWLEIFILDIVVGLIGHGFSQDILLTLVFSLGCILVGVGVSWRWKIVLVFAPFASLALPILNVLGLDDGLREAPVLDLVFLIFLLFLNGYYFYYNIRILCFICSTPSFCYKIKVLRRPVEITTQSRR